MLASWQVSSPACQTDRTQDATWKVSEKGPLQTAALLGLTQGAAWQ